MSLTLKGILSFISLSIETLSVMFDSQYPKSSVARAMDFLQTLIYDGWLNLNLRNLHGIITKVSEWHGEKEELVCRQWEPSE